MAERTPSVFAGHDRPASTTSDKQAGARTALEIVRSGERTERIEQIPLGRILIDPTMVDDIHAGALADNMALIRGQLSPIVVRAREQEGEIVYDIIDGFHRSAGKRSRGEETITANVLYSCSDEELYDKRILAVFSVRSVQFARLGQWMDNAWQQTPWANYLNVTQAFSMAVFESQTSRFPNVEPTDVENIKKWVREKSISWQRPLSALWSDLRLIDTSDPELVKQVRPSSGGKDRQRVLSKGMLKAVSERFPGGAHYKVQRALVAYALDQRLGAGETEELVFRVGNRIDTKASYEEIVKQIATAAREDSPRSANSGIDSHAPTSYTFSPPEEELVMEDNNLLDDPDMIPLPSPTYLSLNGNGHREDGDLTHQDSMDLNEGIEEEHEGEMRKNRRIHPDNSFSYHKLGPVALLEKVLEMDEKLRAAERRAEEAGNNFKFWETATYLSALEREALRLLFGECQTLDDAAWSLKITPPRIIQVISSALTKRGNYLDGENYFIEKEKVS